MTARTAIRIDKFMRDERLLGNSFKGSSWDLWQAVIKAAFAVPLTREEQASFRAVADRDPPPSRVKELVAIVGRGGGKDSIASLIATHVAVSFDPRGKLRPGEFVYVLCIACDRDQAAIVHRYIKAYFEETPALLKMVVDTSADSITLSNRVIIQVSTNSFRTPRGRSILAGILDEAAQYRSDDSANPDFELHAALRPGLARVKNSMLVIISSAYRRAGLLYARYKDYYGKDGNILVVKGTTQQFNSLSDADEIAKDIAEDPPRYNAEYNSIWRDDLSTFISRELIEAAVDRGVTVRSPQPNVRYASFCDPSGGASDSFTAAVAHSEKGIAVLDCLVEIKAPFNPDSATAQIADTLKSYGVRRTTSDRYAAQWVVAAFARNGITLAHSERDRSEIYLDALPLFSSGRARLIDNQRLVSQFAALERRTFPTGKDRVDHGRNGHDDCANSASGALVLATTRKESTPIRAETLQRAREATPYSRNRLTGPLMGTGGQAMPNRMKVFF